MASKQITCPDCKSVLRPAKPVPDGKKVKCPKCGTLFTTPGLVEEERPRKKESSKQKAKAGIKKASSPPPPPKPAAVEEDDDGGGLYSYIPEEEKAEEDKPQIEYAPDLSIKDLRGPAQAAVVAPSNYLLLVNGVSSLSNIFLICVMFWPMVFTESPVDWQAVLSKHYKGDKSAVQRVEGIKEYKDIKDEDLKIVHEAEAEERVKRFSLMGAFIGLLIYNGFAIFGTVKLQNLESRRWGIAASVMTILPMAAGGISALVGGLFFHTIGAWVLEEMSLTYSIGLSVLPYLLALFVGVWALRTVLSQEVVDGFEYVAE